MDAQSFGTRLAQGLLMLAGALLLLGSGLCSVGAAASGSMIGLDAEVLVPLLFGMFALIGAAVGLVLGLLIAAAVGERGRILGYPAAGLALIAIPFLAIWGRGGIMDAPVSRWIPIAFWIAAAVMGGFTAHEAWRRWQMLR